MHLDLNRRKINLNLETFSDLLNQVGSCALLFSLPLGTGVYNFDLGQYLFWENSFLF